MFLRVLKFGLQISGTPDSLTDQRGLIFYRQPPHAITAVLDNNQRPNRNFLAVVTQYFMKPWVDRCRCFVVQPENNDAGFLADAQCHQVREIKVERQDDAAFDEGVQEAPTRVARSAMYDDPRVAGGPDVLSESAR